MPNKPSKPKSDSNLHPEEIISKFRKEMNELYIGEIEEIIDYFSAYGTLQRKQAVRFLKQAIVYLKRDSVGNESTN